jgi:16S rRNA (adenine1518-N6/adenine1519-N6)-dimethyltransferase
VNKKPTVYAKPRQSLGQNFLIDQNIVRKIIAGFRPLPGDVVMEIGPGRGALTHELAGKVKHLILVEIDGRIIEDLRTRFASPAVTVLHQDILDVDIGSWREVHGAKIRLLGNIPYHLTSPILFKAFDERASVKDVTIMAQKEVTRRVVAKPGSKEYGILSVAARLYGTPEILFDISPHCFYPKPKVTSSILHITFFNRLPDGVNPELFSTVVRTVFGKRRKTLRNGLKYLPYTEAAVERIMDGVTVSLDKRPEQLTPEQFFDLTNQIERLVA